MQRRDMFGGRRSPQKSDGIYRAALRGQSSHVRERAEMVARELAKGGLRAEPGRRSCSRPGTKRDALGKMSATY
jgi:hypothetical protein